MPGFRIRLEVKKDALHSFRDHSGLDDFQFQRTIPRAGIHTFQTAGTFGVVQVKWHIFDSHRTFDVTTSATVALIGVGDNPQRLDFHHAEIRSVLDDFHRILSV